MPWILAIRCGAIIIWNSEFRLSDHGEKLNAGGQPTPTVRVYAVMNYADTQSKLPYVYTAVPLTSTVLANGQWQFTGQVNDFQNYQWVTVIVENLASDWNGDGVSFDYSAHVSPTGP